MENEKAEEEILSSIHDELQHSSEIIELEHFGILGQKWGIRKYQNPDGTLTEAGKARYNDDGSLKNPKTMSNKDLQESSNRLAAEGNYANLTGRSQPGKSLSRDTAVKVGAAFVASAGASLLFRKLRTGKWLEGNSRESQKKRIGKTVVTALLTGAVGSVIVGASSAGGSVYQGPTGNSKPLTNS